MNNPNVKLLIKIANTDNNLAQFTLHKGAQLDASIISPERLIEMHNGVWEAFTIEEKIQASILTGVMGTCAQDITGTCTIKEAVGLIRALNHKQEIILLFSCNDFSQNY